MSFYARHCTVATMDAELAQAFVAENHRQSTVTVSTSVVHLGLFHGEELVAVAQFCHPRTEVMARRYSVELLRLAFKRNVRVIGGASKLISHYRKVYHPADIFTYQDATGELTDVYERCGFTLVSQAKKKEYLVAPGKTLATASRREALGMAYATRYGPDRILGTKLGEVLDPETGKRKSNKRIFIEDLGWHLEETPGDRVYEWVDPNRTYYVYRITASDSDKYYIGVRGLRLHSESVDVCHQDDYWGSGSKKYQRWKARHGGKLEKEILHVCHRKAEAYEFEKKSVGDSWKTDPLCLNSAPGGRHRSHIASPGILSEKKICSRHGLTLHRGDSCYRCVTESTVTEKECPVHGLAFHQGETCTRCSASPRLTEDHCPVHERTAFYDGRCVKCSASAQVKTSECAVHGITAHRGRSCYRCEREKVKATKRCAVHGLSVHYGETCRKCVTDSYVTEKSCPVHGVVKHLGTRCYLCMGAERFSEALCSVHGFTKHLNGRCYRCVAAKSKTNQDCPVHGLTTFRGETCLRCKSEKQIGMRECPEHGLVKHNGKTCYTCSAEKRQHKKHTELVYSCRYCLEKLAGG